jgi:uncharacterized repeat protein (TIGR01451 family)
MTSIIVITSILIASPFAMQTGYAGLFQDVGLTLGANVIAKVTEGGTATYSFTSTNNGLGYLVDCSLEDNRLGTIGTFDLKEGSVEVITVNAVIYETVANTAILRCFDYLGTEHTVESSTVVVSFDSSATLEKTVDATTVNAGETVEYTYTVVNTGESNLSCSLVDDKINLGLGNLFFSQDEQRTFTADAVISEDTTNLATLECESQLGDEFSVTSTQTVTIIPDRILVHIDIKPESCPNPVNINSRGLLPVAILGNEVDVSQIDVSTIQLAGVSPIRDNIEDVATPHTPDTAVVNPNDCTIDGPDGIDDLTLKFDTQQVLDALDASRGDVIQVLLTGNLLDGTVIHSYDVIIIR